MTRALESALDGLHGLLAETMTDELSRALHRARQPRMVSKVEGGKPVEVSNPDYAPLSPQLLAQVIKFLKDNGIDAPAKAGRVSGLAAALADIDLEQVANEGLRPN